MLENYTQSANERCFQLIDADAGAIWADIESTPEDTDSARWRKKLEAIAREYSFSSRFALMRILFARAAELDLTRRETESALSGGEEPALVCGDWRFPLSALTIDRAETLSPEDNLRFEQLLRETAGQSPDADEAANTALLRRAWYDEESAILAGEALLPPDRRENRRKLAAERAALRQAYRPLFRTRLTRREAFRLGHLLRLSLQEMQWFLLRVFDAEDGFQYNRAEDLIEAYGFLTDAGQGTVAALHAAYAARAPQIKKKPLGERAADWTADAAGSLGGLAQRRLSRPDEGDEPFLGWLLEQAPCLDLPSRTALAVFRNLAVYAWHLALEEEDPPIESDLVRCVREITGSPEEDDAAREALYENGQISAKRCAKVAGDIMAANLDLSFSDQTDRAKAYHVITAKEDGTPTSTGGVNASRTRLQELLLGELQVEKSDLLYLLWFAANQCWSWNGASQPGEIFDRMADFVECAWTCLENALLPPFYPPHLLEQSMLLSIACAGKTGETDITPAETYELLCSSLIVPRRRRKDVPS